MKRTHHSRDRFPSALNWGLSGLAGADGHKRGTHARRDSRTLIHLVNVAVQSLLARRRSA